MIAAFVAVGLLAPNLRAPLHSSEGFVPIFNGKNLDGWTPKIKGYKYGDNFGNTFRVEGGAIKVRYDGYGGKFDGRFGHLYYKERLSNYVLRLEYRFTGVQLPDGPGWAFRNSGVMIHGQDPRTMPIDQDFPVSCEVQFLGGPETGERATGNVCTPGTNIVMNGKLITQHCTDSTSPTYRGDGWVKVEIEVHGHGAIIHRVDGKEVLRYEKVQYDPKDASAQPLIEGVNLKIDGGTISLQSESHPVEFRNVMLKQL